MSNSVLFYGQKQAASEAQTFFERGVNGGVPGCTFSNWNENLQKLEIGRQNTQKTV